MLERFTKNIELQNLLSANDRILIAVSGGIDSVVLLNLISKLSFPFAIAHCNFHLRGTDSNADAQFVKLLSEKYHAPIFSTDFDTTQYAKEKGVSIEMAARELRYRWFEEICVKYGYTKIATGHHQDDQIETFFLNLSRGAGISGLRGMLPKQNKIIRPLLPFNRVEIKQYLSEQKLSYREDCTNESSEYQRNYIRHEIIPLFDKINPSFKNTLNKTMGFLKDTETIFKQKITETKAEIIQQNKDIIKIDIPKLNKLNPLPTYLFEILKTYNFNTSQNEDILHSLNGQPGKVFYSSTHELIKDRNQLIIYPICKNDDNEYIITPSEYPDFIKLEIIQNQPDFYNNPSNIAYFDLEKIQFPLILRHWKEGDYFYPLGMKQRKKISDFFTDIKLSSIEKKQAMLLCMKDDILWVVNQRIDNRYKTTNQTKKILKISILTNH